MRKKKSKGEKDWRSLPRKDTEHRSERITIRVTKSEMAGIRALSKHARMTVSDYLVCKALRKGQRVVQ